MSAPAAPLPAGRSIRVPWALGAAMLAIAALAVAQVGAAGHPRKATARADLNSLIHGAPLQRARCSNWLAATGAERALAARALASTVGAPTEYAGVRGTALTQAQAYTLLDGTCSRPFARNFLLYELYIRAAGFGGAGL